MWSTAARFLLVSGVATVIAFAPGQVVLDAGRRERFRFIATVATALAGLVFAIGWGALKGRHPGREVLHTCLVIAVPLCLAVAIWMEQRARVRVGVVWAVVAGLAASPSSP